MHPAIQYESIYKYIKQHRLLSAKYDQDLETIVAACRKSTSDPSTIYQFNPTCEGMFDLLWQESDDSK